jgi:hypothetical protein
MDRWFLQLSSVWLINSNSHATSPLPQNVGVCAAASALTPGEVERFEASIATFVTLGESEARDVALSLARYIVGVAGTLLDRLNHPAQRIVRVVAELKQFGTLAASGRGASRAWHQHVDQNVVALALVNDRTDHGGVSQEPLSPHAWRGLPSQASMEKGWPGWNARGARLLRGDELPAL